MNIAIGSAFRNSSFYAARYLRQVENLRRHAGAEHQIRVIAAEGDSVDNTRQLLQMRADVCGIDLTIVDVTHGKRWFGSTEEPDRLETMSKVGNAIFDAVRATDDVLVYVESDLLWDAHTIGSLIDMAVRRDGGFDVFAPMVMAGEHFYDIWAFRKGGERFGPFKPFALLNDGLTEIDSAGSCLVMRGDVARECRIDNGNCLVGWCDGARAKGFKIAVHPSMRIDHP